MRPHALTLLLGGAVSFCGTLISSSIEAQQTSARRVWADPVEDARDGGSLSPDAKFYAFSARPGAADLAIRTLATGETHYLTGSRAPQKTSDAHAYTPVFSRDGKQLAYAWDIDTVGGYEVRVINIDGSSAHAIYRPVGDYGPIPTDWTPDGRFVVAMESTPDRMVRLLILPVAGGPPRILKSFLDWERPTQAQVSPDGKYLAYDYRPRQDRAERDVYLLALDGTPEASVATGPSDDRLVGWTPDGRLVFASDRNGSPAVWAQRVENGHARGEPALVKKDLWRSTGLQMTANGTFFYAVQTGDRDVCSAAIDAATGRLLSKPVSITQHPGEPYSIPDISAGGRFIAYLIGSPEVRSQKYARFGTTTIAVQSLHGGQSRTLRPKLAGITRFKWGLDDETLIVDARDDKGRPVSQRLDLKTGEASITNYADHLPSFSADREWTFEFVGLGSKMRDRVWRVVAHHRADGAERELYATPEPGWAPVGSGVRSSLLVSPDGQSLVFSLGHNGDSTYAQRLMVIGTQGGSPRELVSPTAFPHTVLRPASFTPDGKYILLMTSEFAGPPPWGPSRLWRVPIAGGAPQPIEMPRTDFDLPILSPDGRSLLFTAGKVAVEYWVLEDSRLGYSSAHAGSIRK